MSSTTTIRPSSTYASWGGRSRGGSNRGRGRTTAANAHGDGEGRSDTNPRGSESTARNSQPAKPRLTHFLSLPIGHHAALRANMTSLTSSLLSSAPPIPGLHHSIVIPARRLHLTLGVMPLSEDPPHTLAAASELLQSLEPRISALLRNEPLRVGLERMDVMNTERGDPEHAHVLYVGPDLSNDDGQRLRAVCDLVHIEFTKNGFLADERRPLKLHCTVINTTYRKPRPRGARLPFSYRSLLESGALLGVAGGATQASPETGGPVDVSLGSWDVTEIQICEMGSWGPEGEYVRVAGCSLL